MSQDLEARPVPAWPGTPNMSRAGRVWFAGQPGPEGLRAAAAEGVGLVVNLRQAQEMHSLPFDEPALVKQLGMRYENIPIIPESFCCADVERFARLLESTGGPVLVHCGSSNRVGGLWAAYAARHRSVALEAALLAGRKAGLRGDSMVEAVRRVAGAG